jgi:hypothetical protein
MARWLAGAVIALLSTMGRSGRSDAPGPGVRVLVKAALGGTVSLADGPTLEIPPGALARDTTITISETGTAAQNDHAIYEFGPSPLDFLTPVTVTLPLPSDVLPGFATSVYWSSGGGHGGASHRRGP